MMTILSKNWFFKSTMMSILWKDAFDRELSVKGANSSKRIFFDWVITRWQLANVSYLAEVSMLIWIVNSEKDGGGKMWLADKWKEVQRLVKAVQTAMQRMRPVQILRWQSKLVVFVYPCFAGSEWIIEKLEIPWTFVSSNKWLLVSGFALRYLVS